MGTELKEKIENDIKKRNITPKSIFQTIKNSLNGIVSYAKEGKSIVIYVASLIIEIIMGFVYNINGL